MILKFNILGVVKCHPNVEGWKITLENVRGGTVTDFYTEDREEAELISKLNRQGDMAVFRLRETIK